MILIAYGANLDSPVGKPVETFHAALVSLKSNDVDILAQSSLWKTQPVDTPDIQPDYTNAVMQVRTTIGPRDLLSLLMKIEQDFGRKRPFRNAAKCIDLDLLAYGEHTINQEDLTVPHPRMHQRGFVLYPLQEIAPNWCHPVLKRNVDEMIASLPKDHEAVEKW